LKNEKLGDDFMKQRKEGSCTTILVGKKASIDGSTMIARNEDSGSASSNPQRFIVMNPQDQPRHYKSVQSAFEIDLPENPMRYTSTPDAAEGFGIWGESGINSANVAMTATETITTNTRVLGADPFVDNGIGEEDMLTLVLPYVHSAKEGVQRLGSILEQYGTYESNGIAFSDADDVWYMETIGGHHWAAVRIPDDAYVVAPNRFNIDHFDFDSADTLCSEGLREFIEVHHLNPDFEGYNLRHIFGSASIKDTRYNNPRAWYVQQFFNPEIEQQPMEQNLPFICHANRKISVEDVKWALSSHFQNTEFDPYGEGSEDTKFMFRTIGINRNQECHILQIRPDVSPEIAGVHWLAFGPNTFNAIVPFYANVLDTPACYRDTKSTFDITKIHWLSHTIALLGDTNFDLYSDLHRAYEQKTVASCRNMQLLADREATKQTDIQAYLGQVNEEMATLCFNNTNQLLGNMMATGTKHMSLNFSLND